MNRRKSTKAKGSAANFSEPQANSDLDELSILLAEATKNAETALGEMLETSNVEDLHKILEEAIKSNQAYLSEFQANNNVDSEPTFPDALPLDIAHWMLETLEKVNFLYQHHTATTIKSRFGDKYIYKARKHSSGLYIKQEVLTEFRKLTENTVVWERSNQLWRKRRPSDPPGRQVK